MRAHTLIGTPHRPALIAAKLRWPAPAASQQNICATSLAPAVLLHTVSPVNIQNFTKIDKTPDQSLSFCKNTFAKTPYSDVNRYRREKAGQAVKGNNRVVAEPTPTNAFPQVRGGFPVPRLVC